MPLMLSAVLEDPRHRVPAAPSADAGPAWPRLQVPRFCDGPEQDHRGATVDDIVSVPTVISNLTADPAVLSFQGLGLPTACLADRRTGSAGPPRRVAPDGTTVEVDLADAPFGRGPHACPGRAIAEAWVEVLG
ncbi:hypothetical protein [Geodermatophilus maliterrae]|uniref:Cytochrome P450 n=1 Tax=Geodermatophilus maliterrae TaxID=3162531 RepID=A0ABV3XIV7_9ACTN